MSALLGKLLSSVGQEAAFQASLESCFPCKSESCFLPTKPLGFLKINRHGLQGFQQFLRILEQAQLTQKRASTWDMETLAMN